MRRRILSLSQRVFLDHSFKVNYISYWSSCDSDVCAFVRLCTYPVLCKSVQTCANDPLKSPLPEWQNEIVNDNYRMSFAEVQRSLTGFAVSCSLSNLE